VPIVGPTGIHRARYYPPDHPLLALDRDRLVELFLREIVAGVDDGAGIRNVRAGVTKVANSDDRLTSQEHERFVAAALAQRQNQASATHAGDPRADKFKGCYTIACSTNRAGRRRRW
jgi:predicted metal-dependent phosphotriesterase family hydrolase